MTNPLLVGVVGCPGGNPSRCYLYLYEDISTQLFRKLEQRIQAEASNIDNYLEQRVQILQNVVGLVERAIDLDKDVMKAVAALRSGGVNEGNRSDVNAQVNTAFGRLFPQVEAYRVESA